MMSRRRAPPPPIELAGQSNMVSMGDDRLKSLPEESVKSLPEESVEVLQRMDNLLALPGNDPKRPDLLDDPPRKLLLAQQVLQVVNSHTVKDRYLFLFNDLLVITKPMITHGVQATLDMKYLVKSVVSLDRLTVNKATEELTQEPPRHPVVNAFIQQFADNAPAAVHQLVDRSVNRVDATMLASLLFKTPELDKAQLGQLLASEPKLLDAYIRRFHFGGVRIDDALRMFLLSIRMPTDTAAAEALMRGFADGFHDANQNNVPFDHIRARDLVIATLELNDMLYSTFGFAFPNQGISPASFIASFRPKDPNWLVDDELLEDIYYSIRGNKLVQALASHELASLARDITIKPERMSSKLTFNQWSDPITIAIPRADPSFSLTLLGQGLEFDPTRLDFTSSAEASFRVRGTTLGPKTMLLARCGTNAAQYASLGNSRTFTVERNCMRHTFSVQFVSVPDAAARQRWTTILPRQVWLTTEKRQGAGAPTTEEGRVRRATEAVAIQVLRDALLPSEARSQSKLARPGRSQQPSPEKEKAHGHMGHLRNASVSVAYAARAADEAAQGLKAPAPAPGTATTDSDELHTGKELVLLCRQNSLLPTVLELLQPQPERTPPTGVSGASSALSPAPTASAPFSASMPYLVSGNVPTYPAVPHSASPYSSTGRAGMRAMMHGRRL
jgi:hypothetical protein